VTAREELARTFTVCLVELNIEFKRKKYVVGKKY